jgi:hypothetical protein
MARKDSRLLLATAAVIGVALVLAGAFFLWNERRPRDVNDLWQLEYQTRHLEGTAARVRGALVFDPSSDFRFNAIYLLDSSTPAELRTPENGFWFGIGLDGVSCVATAAADALVCEPFDPTQASAYEFTGTLHLAQVGKKEVMWLSDIDFEHGRRLVDGRWQPIPLGRFVIPLSP